MAELIFQDLAFTCSANNSEDDNDGRRAESFQNGQTNYSVNNNDESTLISSVARSPFTCPDKPNHMLNVEVFNDDSKTTATTVAAIAIKKDSSSSGNNSGNTDTTTSQQTTNILCFIPGVVCESCENHRISRHNIMRNVVMMITSLMFIFYAIIIICVNVMDGIYISPRPSYSFCDAYSMRPLVRTRHQKAVFPHSLYGLPTTTMTSIRATMDHHYHENNTASSNEDCKDNSRHSQERFNHCHHRTSSPPEQVDELVVEKLPLSNTTSRRVDGRISRRSILVSSVGVASSSATASILTTFATMNTKDSTIDPCEIPNSFASNSNARRSNFGMSMRAANALTPTEASTAYDKYASTYNDLDGGRAATSLGIDDARKQLLQLATGNVLEIGCGTGLNLPNYNMNQISSLTLMDISSGMIEQAQRRTQEITNIKDTAKGKYILPTTRIQFVQGDATTELVSKFAASDKFDTIVDSFSLCVMGDTGARDCLQQMANVIKPNTGRILLLENTRSSNNLLGWYQDITATSAANMGGKGCVYNQNVRSMIESIPGLEILKEEQYAAGLFRSYQCRLTV